MKNISAINSLQFQFLMIFIVFCGHSIFGQTVATEKMKALSFMVGDWQGISTSYENDTISNQVSAAESISFKLDKNIITIDLKSETLQLHTVIYYDEKKGTYFYNPFYIGGTGKFPAQFTDGQLIVSPSDTKRFVFELTAEGKFHEYGEKLVDGKWIKYFEDIFENSNPN